MKRRLLLNLLVLFLAGVWEASAQLPVPVLPLNQPAGAPSSSSPVAAAPSVAPAVTTAVPSPAAPGAVPGLLNGYVPDDTYKLRPGDSISFQILQDRIWNPQSTPLSLTVMDSGEVEVPYIGRVMAAGKTCKELADDIKTALEKNYYKQATVVVSLNVANRILGRVYIWGQVRNQGAIDLQVNENLTAGKAILRAGGFADFANKKKVKVVRTEPDGKTKTFELDMEQILDEGKVNEDVVLKPNDLIIVPSRLINF